MTAITFPNSPSSGDTHTAGNGIVYTYDGEKWTSIGTNSAGTWTRTGTTVALTTPSDNLTANTATFGGAVNFDDDVIVKGDATNGSGELTLNCENNSHGIKIKGPPHSAGASYTLTLPNDTGTNGQVLTTNGSGVSSWSTIDLSSKLSLTGGTLTGGLTGTSATFTGDFTNGSFPSGNGLKTDVSNGILSLRNDNASASNGSEQAFRIYSGGQNQSDITAQIDANGTASFAGQLIVDRGLANTSNAASIIVANNQNNTAIRLNNNGSAEFSSYVSIGGTAAANTIDEYEEGTWTPRIGSQNGSDPPAGSGNAGWYTRIGDLVFATATLVWGSGGSISGSVQIKGFPFAAKNQTSWRSSSAINNTIGLYANSGYTNLSIGFDQNQTFTWVTQHIGTNSGSNYNHTPSVVTAGGIIFGLSIVYQVN